jgi:glyoxalase-like protein
LSTITLDHLVVAAETLADGTAFVEAHLGVRPQPGGKHAGMGTHNALLGLGPGQYLEIIAIDPEGAKPARPHWFDLDEPRMRAALAECPRLVHWAARTDDIDATTARSRIDVGAIRPMSRGDLHWRITITDDGHMPGAGLVPALIQWPANVTHPSERLLDSGIRLVTLAGEHPDPATIRAALAALGLSETLKVTYGRHPRLAAMLRTPRGVVTL